MENLSPREKILNLFDNVLRFNLSNHPSILELYKSSLKLNQTLSKKREVKIVVKAPFERTKNLLVKEIIDSHASWEYYAWEEVKRDLGYLSGSRLTSQLEEKMWESLYKSEFPHDVESIVERFEEDFVEHSLHYPLYWVVNKLHKKINSCNYLLPADLIFPYYLWEVYPEYRVVLKKNKKKIRALFSCFLAGAGAILMNKEKMFVIPLYYLRDNKK